MGFGGISIWQLAIVLVIVILLFGTKRLKGVGSDLGEAIKGFRKSVNTEDEKPSVQDRTSGETHDVEPERKKQETRSGD
ncbi:twin-arginine translocase TatA/TatE family subunit [Halopseudomonas sp.]|jgi:sec-independent protein translocase protein TatA|uniref:twin-arginine translocase TatA/TatE family subunit n=1 Tax=Halopseudomonas sp. TaxID=2901191 RepID=UPI001A3DAB17|nr:twin-arginine translocase TatA/TatE family subunit [Pseudomonas sp.]|tara:strand:- start:3293 stop:3529 length:237 start_codon:yes stop_codon:yes gene_type:complete